MSNTRAKLLSNKFLLPLCLCIFSFLSIWAMYDRSYWLDELFTLYIIKLNLNDFFYVLSVREANMSLYYFALKMWSNISIDLIFLRFFSLLIGLACAFFQYKLALKLFENKKIALFSCLVLVTNLLFFYYAQEVRGYSLYLLLSIILLYYFVIVIDSPSVKSWFIYALIASLLTYSHVLGVTFVFAQLLTLLLIKRREYIKSLFFVGVFIFFLISPVVLFVLTVKADPVSWVPDTTFSKVIIFFSRFIFGEGKSDYIIILLCSVFYIPCLILGFVGVIRSKSDKILSILYLFICSSLLIICLALLKPILVTRFFIYLLPLIVLFTSYGFYLSVNWIKPFFLIFTISTLLLGADSLRDKKGDDWIGVGKEIMSSCENKKVNIFVFRDAGMFGYNIFRDSLKSACSNVSFVQPQKAREFYGRERDTVFPILSLVKDSNIVWYVSYVLKTKEHEQLNQFYLDSLESLYVLDEKIKFGDSIILYKFSDASE